MRKSDFLLFSIGIVYIFLVVMGGFFIPIELEFNHIAGISLFAACIAMGDTIEIFTKIKNKERYGKIITYLSYFIAVFFFIIIPLFSYSSSLYYEIVTLSISATIASFSFIFLSIAGRENNNSTKLAQKGYILIFCLGIVYFSAAILHQLNIVSFEEKYLCAMTILAFFVTLDDTINIIWKKVSYAINRKKYHYKVSRKLTGFLYLLAALSFVLIPNVNLEKYIQRYSDQIAFYKISNIVFSILSFSLIFISISLRDTQEQEICMEEEIMEKTQG